MSESSTNPDPASSFPAAAGGAAIDTVQHHRVIDFLGDAPASIGPYHILEPIGQGGMGIVYKAEQREPVRRIVALKLMKFGTDTRELVARFESERQALAMMDHPNVARVFDAGATESGRPYFVMEFVAGESITDYCDRQGLSIRQRLELFAQACEAVRHAHQKTIVHRDLKPSNILVAANPLAGGASGTEAARGLVKVIDFGVAKALAQPLTQRTLFTERGQLLGTPEYMSPEQADMNLASVDTRTDVYSLGVVLYEMLTGALPFDARSLRSAGYHEIQRIIREQEPARPSARLDAMDVAAGRSVATHRRTRIDELTRQLRGELEWIPLRAMRKNPGERYPTVDELLADVHNYLSNRPLRAGPPSVAYRLRKLARRHRTAVFGVAAVGLALILGSAATAWQAIRATRAQRQTTAALREVERQRQHAEDRQQEAEAVNDFLRTSVLSGATPRRMPDKAVRDAVVRVMLDPAAAAVGDAFADRPLIEAAVRNTLLNCYRDIGEREAALKQARRALELRQRALGVDHLDTLTSLNNLAGLLVDQGDLAGAEPLLRQVVESSRRVLGPKHTRTLSFTGNLATALRLNRKLAEAEPFMRETLEGSRDTLGEDHPDTLLAAGNLASLLSDTGRLAECEAINRAVLASAVRVRGERDVFTLSVTANLASALRAQGKLPEAATLLLRASNGFREVLGDAHPDTDKTMGAYANVLREMNELSAAESAYVELLAVRRRTRGDDHVQTLAAMHYLGAVLFRQERYTDAEPIVAELYRRAESASPSSVPPKNAAMFMSRYGPCLVRLGKLAEAETVLREAHRRLRAAGDADRQAELLVLESLAELCDRTARAEEARHWRSEHTALSATSVPSTRRTTRPS